MKKTLQKYLLIAAAALFIIFLFQKITWLPSFKNFFRSPPVVIEETPIIIREINTLSQLITITYADEVVMDTIQNSNRMPSLVSTGIGMMLMPSSDRLVIIGKGKVIAGMNLKNVQQKDIGISGDSIHITLPAPQILTTVVNPSGFETFAEEGDWNEEAVIDLKIKIKTEITRRALQQNILGQAGERGQNIIKAFLKSTGFQKIDISIDN